MSDHSVPRTEWATVRVRSLGFFGKVALGLAAVSLLTEYDIKTESGLKVSSGPKSIKLWTYEYDSRSEATQKRDDFMETIRIRQRAEFDQAMEKFDLAQAVKRHK